MEASTYRELRGSFEDRPFARSDASWPRPRSRRSARRPVVTVMADAGAAASDTGGPDFMEVREAQKDPLHIFYIRRLERLHEPVTSSLLIKAFSSYLAAADDLHQEPDRTDGRRRRGGRGRHGARSSAWSRSRSCLIKSNSLLLADASFLPV